MLEYHIIIIDIRKNKFAITMLVKVYNGNIII